MEKISVAMPYYNRRDELERSIRAYEQLYDDIELSIVDDRSSPSLVVPETRLDVVFSRIDGTPEPRNPCVPMNLAVNQSSHDVIVLTGPEIQHVTPVFEAMLDILGPNTYVTAKCVEPSGKYLVPRVRDHDIPENSGFHFCTMLTRELWDRAGGFDPVYRDGQAHEDVDWLYTLDSVGAEFKMINGEVLHHPTHVNWGSGHGRNRNILRKKWNL